MSLRRINRKIRKSPVLRNGLLGILLVIIAFHVAKVVVFRDMFAAVIAIAAFILFTIVYQAGRKY